jgi:Pyridoxamine 5'-phosphate oxidase
MPEPTRWPDSVDEILDADHIVALAYVTPAKGVVIAPVTNFGVRDREAGTVTVNSSVGAWKKLDRIRRNPHVALAFHTREHGSSGRPEYVLVQGTAALSEPIPDYPNTIIDRWERFDRWRDVHPLWKRWQRIYALRVGIEIAAQRVVVWPDLACRGKPEVHGAPLSSERPASQRPPARGTGPRINHRRAAKRARRLPNALLGWVGGDGFPVVVPIEVREANRRGIVLEGSDRLAPPGGRRAGLTAHWFAPRVIGQNQRIHTGWLEAGAGDAGLVYAPHTSASYRFPASEPTYRFVSGLGTRWRYRQGRRAGRLPDGLP